jgi:hypothetical protein
MDQHHPSGSLRAGPAAAGTTPIVASSAAALDPFSLRAQFQKKNGAQPPGLRAVHPTKWMR